MEQILVSIGRENGSGGRDIASQIARELEIELYDVRILREVAKEFNIDMDPGELLKYEEAPKKLFSSRTRGEHTNSVEEILAQRQFEYINERAKTGESFVVVGRCADYVLKDFKGIIKIFVTADHDKKIERIAIRHNVDKSEAEKMIKKTDKGRKQYYERYASGKKWGDPFWHDIVINSSRLGVDGTAKVLLKYITDYRKMIYND